jgi:CHAT domain-containing protein
VRGGCEGADPLGLELSARATFCESEVRAAGAKLPLVVLAACETGGGAFVDAEGLESLARAFLESGTTNVLVTSWPVDDASAREFAVAFHRALATGNSPSIAARNARATLRARGASSADWAAFRFVGCD